ncbi:hypothetical protein HDU97_001440 [Phlyctochytrium planicorne]|nr:hypothetical protein HDU97_001440 [Phlyctochytrium planicorne]
MCLVCVRRKRELLAKRRKHSGEYMLENGGASSGGEENEGGKAADTISSSSRSGDGPTSSNNTGKPRASNPPVVVIDDPPEDEVEPQKRPSGSSNEDPIHFVVKGSTSTSTAAARVSKDTAADSVHAVVGIENRGSSLERFVVATGAEREGMGIGERCFENGYGEGALLSEGDRNKTGSKTNLLAGVSSLFKPKTGVATNGSGMKSSPSLVALNKRACECAAEVEGHACECPRDDAFLPNFNGCVAFPHPNLLVETSPNPVAAPSPLRRVSSWLKSGGSPAKTSAGIATIATNPDSAPSSKEPSPINSKQPPAAMLNITGEDPSSSSTFFAHHTREDDTPTPKPGATKLKRGRVVSKSSRFFAFSKSTMMKQPPTDVVKPIKDDMAGASGNRQSVTSVGDVLNTSTGSISSPSHFHHHLYIEPKSSFDSIPTGSRRGGRAGSMVSSLWSPSVSRRGSRSSFGTRDSQGGYVYRVLGGYKPRRPDEIAVSRGDLLSVYTIFEDSWAYGLNVTTGKTGVFPLNSVRRPHRRSRNNGHIHSGAFSFQESHSASSIRSGSIRSTGTSFLYPTSDAGSIHSAATIMRAQPRSISLGFVPPKNGDAGSILSGGTFMGSIVMRDGNSVVGVDDGRKDSMSVVSVRNSVAADRSFNGSLGDHLSVVGGSGDGASIVASSVHSNSGSVTPTAFSAGAGNGNVVLPVPLVVGMMVPGAVPVGMGDRFGGVYIGSGKGDEVGSASTGSVYGAEEEEDDEESGEDDDDDEYDDDEEDDEEEEEEGTEVGMKFPGGGLYTPIPPPRNHSFFPRSSSDSATTHTTSTVEDDALSWRGRRYRDIMDGRLLAIMSSQTPNSPPPPPLSSGSEPPLPHLPVKAGGGLGEERLVPPLLGFAVGGLEEDGAAGGGGSGVGDVTVWHDANEEV